MGLISIDNMEDGVDASANLWNERFGKITDTINGNIETVNLKNNAVTREKIAPGSVTNDKLGLEFVYENDGNFIKFGNFMIQWGTSLVAHTGTSLTFARPFSGIPGVVVSEEDPNSQTPWVTLRTNTAFTCKQPWTPHPIYISWIAVGPA